MGTSLRGSVVALEHGESSRESWPLGEKKSFSASEQDRPDVEARRQAFWNKAAQLSRRRLIFIDESGCNTAMTPRYARALIGDRAHAARPVNRGKNISIIGAIRLSGVVAVRSFEGAINGDKFLSFLERDLLPFTRSGDILIMDNLRVHRDPEVLARIEQAGVRVLFLPPYSPEFNPIELYWSSFKRLLRRFEARTKHELLHAIDTIASGLALDMRALFRHCGYA